MFKEENRIWWYLLGVVIMMGLLLWVGRDYVIPVLLGRRPILETVEYRWDTEPNFSIDLTKNYFARFQTSRGVIVVDLYENAAPRNVNNFNFLSSRGYYTNTKFHRLIKDFLFQGGDRNTLDEDVFNDGYGGPGYFVPDEINWDALDFSAAKRQELQDLGYRSTPGLPTQPIRQYSLVMANSLPDTNGSQFFFVLAPNDDPRLAAFNGRFTVIGQLISGADVLTGLSGLEIENPDSANPRPKQDITLQSVEIFTR